MGRKRRGGGEERPATIIFFLDSSELCVEGFGTEGVLNIAAAGGIPVRSVRVLDETTICLTLRTSDVPRLRELLGARYRTEVLRTEGVVPFPAAYSGKKRTFRGSCLFCCHFVSSAVVYRRAPDSGGRWNS